MTFLCRVQSFLGRSFGGWALLFALLYLLAPSLPATSDGVNFLMGVANYDLDRLQPHFPGYPIYMFLAKIISSFCDPAEALRLINIGSAATIFILLIAMRRRGAVLLLLLSPLFLVEGLRFGSDMMGLAMFAIFLKVLERPKERAFTCGFVGGLLLGVRLGYAPLLSGLLIPMLLGKRAMTQVVVGVILGTITWLLPLVQVVGPVHYFNIGQEFIVGHFTGWGQTAFSETESGNRYVALITHLKNNWIMIVVVVAVIASQFRLKINTGEIKKMAILFGPYLIFVCLGQNLNNGRHMLPLVLGGAIILSPWLLNCVRNKHVKGIVCLFAIISIGLSAQINSQRPAPLRVVDRLQAIDHIEIASIWSGETAAFIRWRHPVWSSSEEVDFVDLPTTFLNIPNHRSIFISTKRLDLRFPGRVDFVDQVPADGKDIFIFQNTDNDRRLTWVP